MTRSTFRYQFRNWLRYMLGMLVGFAIGLYVSGCARFFRPPAPPPAVPANATPELPAPMRSFRNANPPVDKTAPNIRRELIKGRRRVAFDFDHDGDVDGIDFTVFAGCYNKAGRPPRCDAPLALLCNQDSDPGDGPFPNFDIDLEDFARFVACFNKAGRPPRPLATVGQVGGCKEIHEERLRFVDVAGNPIENAGQFDDVKGLIRLTPISLPSRITTITITVTPPGWSGGSRAAQVESVAWRNPNSITRR